MEHCVKKGHNFEFVTSNYKIKTTSKKEYSLVLGEAKPDPADMMHSRRIPNLVELQELEMSKSAGLLRIEIIMLVLYTGPMVCSTLLLLSSFVFTFSRPSSSFPYSCLHQQCFVTIYPIFNGLLSPMTFFQQWCISFVHAP